MSNAKSRVEEFLLAHAAHGLTGDILLSCTYINSAGRTETDLRASDLVKVLNQLRAVTPPRPLAPTRAQVETALTHDDHCQRYGEHVAPRLIDHGGAGEECSCSVSQTINDLMVNGWLKLRDEPV